MQARNSNEHGIQDITAFMPGGAGVSARNPAEIMYIDHMTINAGQIHIGPSSKNVLVSFTPTRFLPLEIQNRGIKFSVPTNHLGSDISGFTLSQVAHLAYDYYNELLIQIDEAETENSNS